LFKNISTERERERGFIDREESTMALARIDALNTWHHNLVRKEERKRKVEREKEGLKLGG